MKLLKQDRGFTLIEVVAAIVIIGIVLISFSQLYIQANRIATYNNEKLVVINLANAELERLKLMPNTEVFGTGANLFRKPGNTFATYTPKTIYKDTSINSNIYKVSITASQVQKEHAARLLNISVNVTSPNNKSSSTVEGYITYE